MTFSEIFLDPLNFEFMQRALMASVLVGIISGVVGCFVVVRGMSFFGDALAHSVLPGVAIAYIYAGGAATLPIISQIEDETLRLFIGGLVAGIGSALVIGWLTRGERLKEDTAIGIIFSAMFALGILIISTDSRAYGRDLLHILFGNVLSVQQSDLLIMAICGVIVVGVILLLYKELLLVSFDLTMAQVLQLPAEGIRTLLLVLIAITIVASLQVVGIALMIAMLVTPAATARLLTNRMHTMMMVSAMLGVISGIIGIYLSWHLEVATGPAIVMTITIIFGLVFTSKRLMLRVYT